MTLLADRVTVTLMTFDKQSNACRIVVPVVVTTAMVMVKVWTAES